MGDLITPKISGDCGLVVSSLCDDFRSKRSRLVASTRLLCAASSVCRRIETINKAENAFELKHERDTGNVYISREITPG